MRKAITVLMLLVVWPLWASEKVIIASGEYPPLSGAALPHEGYISHLVELAYAGQGIEVEYRYMPWARTLADTAIGKFPVTIFWFCTEDRKIDFYCSEEPVLEEEVVVFRRADSPIPDWSSFDDLKKYKFGYVRGYAYGEELQKALRNGEIVVEHVNSDIQNYKKLLAGRIDIVLLGKQVGYEILDKYFTPEERAKITNEPHPVWKAKFHLLFPKSRTDALKWRDEFDTGMRELRDSRSYLELKKAYESNGYRSTE